MTIGFVVLDVKYETGYLEIVLYFVVYCIGFKVILLNNIATHPYFNGMKKMKKPDILVMSI